MKSLKGFPEEFQPLVVITGDRREIPPRSRGDVLAYSFSTTDVMYLNHLGIASYSGDQNCALVLSDKQFVIDSEEVLKQRFGSTNILVIGSPAVNLLARRINERCVFKFSISDETKDELDEQRIFMDEFIQDDHDRYIYHRCLEGILDIDVMLARFVELDPHIDALRNRANQIVPEFKKTRICGDPQTLRRPIRYLMHKLDKPGIYDSLSGINRGESIGAAKDYGLITIIQNPFSESNDYYIIYVAGVQGPGTALGVKLLADENSFIKHPFGGVYEVNINSISHYFEKFQNSHVRWETPAYEIKDYPIIPSRKKSLKVFLSSPATQEDITQILFNNEIVTLLRLLCIDKNIKLHFEEPDTLPKAVPHHHDFWENILDYEKDCDFIIHDITDSKKGVMVELGFTLGLEKPYFLIWNTAKSSVEHWNDMNRPSLLSSAHIEMIDTKNIARTRNVLRRTIIEPVIGGYRSFDCSSCGKMSKNKKRKAAYVYALEPKLNRCLSQILDELEIYPLSEEDSGKEMRICQICQVIDVADFVLVQISEEDLDSYIVLGMAKAMKKKTQPLTQDKYNKEEFPWAKDFILYKLDNIEQQLPDKLRKFFS
jgi:nucleoside 2-deoxyribosyltransferase